MLRTLARSAEVSLAAPRRNRREPLPADDVAMDAVVAAKTCLEASAFPASIAAAALASEMLNRAATLRDAGSTCTTPVLDPTAPYESTTSVKHPT